MPRSSTRTLFCFVLRTIRYPSSPPPSSKIPATVKSKISQFTSSVNCMAINGMNKTIPVTSTIRKSLFFIMRNSPLFFSLPTLIHLNQLNIVSVVVVKNGFIAVVGFHGLFLKRHAFLLQLFTVAVLFDVLKVAGLFAIISTLPFSNVSRAWQPTLRDERCHLFVLPPILVKTLSTGSHSSILLPSSSRMWTNLP